MELIRETKWSRLYSMEDLQTKMYESKFADDSASITVEQLQVEWTQWSPTERADFSEAVTQARFPHLPDVLRFIIKRGDFETWSAIANCCVRQLPAAEAMAFVTDVCQRCPVGKGVKFFQALALSKSPQTLPILRKCLERCWNDPQFLDSDSMFDWASYDAVSCMEYLLQLGEPPATLAAKYRILINHPNNLSRQNAINRLGPFYH